MVKIEKSISQKYIYYFNSIHQPEIDSLIKNGDVIAFLSSRNDLDFKHVGFVYIKNNKSISFMPLKKKNSLHFQN